ncbi:hypothetical protein ACLB2K_022039 [Fragaria x ananassa]
MTYRNQNQRITPPGERRAGRASEQERERATGRGRGRGRPGEGEGKGNREKERVTGRGRGRPGEGEGDRERGEGSRRRTSMEEADWALGFFRHSMEAVERWVFYGPDTFSRRNTYFVG